MSGNVAGLADLVLLLVVLTDFWVLATSRVSACIRAVAVQGLLLGGLPVVLASSFTLHTAGLAAGTVVIKAVALPWFLRRAIREASVRREIEPLVGYMTSIVLGAAALAFAFAVAAALPLPPTAARLMVPVALVTVMTGLIVLITRAKAVTQVVGYLMLENGIYVFGLTQSERVPFLVDIGVLLDVFVGVFVMGIVVFHINREFDSMSATNLRELRD
jgi:hydrogenase-4 component E